MVRALLMFKCIISLLLISPNLALGQNTYGLPSERGERERQLGESLSSYVVAGMCNPQTSATTVIPAFACRVHIRRDNGNLVLSNQVATTLNLNQGDGLYTIIMDWKSRGTIPGWTRPFGTRLLFATSAGMPFPEGTVKIAEATVSGGAVTRVDLAPKRNPITNALGVVHVRDFGADGVGDDGPAIQAAIDSVRDGGRVLFGDPLDAIAYNTSQEIIIRNDGVYLQGLGRGTILRPTLAGMNIIRFSGNDGGVSNFRLTCNSLANSTALYIGPEDTNQTTIVDHVNYNVFRNLEIDSCFDTGIRMQTGPDVAGADSGTWYNQLNHIHLTANRIGIHLIDHPTSPSASQVNRNNFYDVRIGCGGGGICNVGVYCQACSTNMFSGVHFEGIQNSAIGPLGTATAIFIQGQAASGANNDENVFLGSIYEANSNDIVVQDANASLNKFIGGNPDPNEVLDNGNGTSFLTSQILKLPGNLQYSSLNAVMSMNPFNGISIDNATAARLSIGALIPGANAGVNVLSTFRAPNSNWGFPVGIIADTSSRAMLIAAQDYNNATSTGNGIFVSTVSPHVRAVTNGGSAETQFGFGIGGITLGPEALALLGAPVNGTIRYCADCTPASNPCVGGGAGAMAFRLNNVWTCQ